MRWFGRFSAIILGLLTIGVIRDFLDKNEILILKKEELDPFEEDEEDTDDSDGFLKIRPDNYDHAMDVRGTPTHLCPCGCNIWNLKVIFDDYEIATYFLDMECANCGSLATAPTPVDKEGIE